MFYKLKGNKNNYYINLNHIAFISEMREEKKILICFISGEHISIKDFSEYEKLLIAIERENI